MSLESVVQLTVGVSQHRLVIPERTVKVDGNCLDKSWRVWCGFHGRKVFYYPSILVDG